MNNTLDLHNTSTYLLTLDPDHDYSSDELDAQEDTADALIHQYGWGAVYQEWSNYLYHSCPTDDDVVRFAFNYFNYASDRPIPDPLRFIAYLYYRVDVSQNERAFDIFDSLAITILPSAGLVNIMEEPCYAAETDPRIQAEIAIWKTEQSRTSTS